MVERPARQRSLEYDLVKRQSNAGVLNMAWVEVGI